MDALENAKTKTAQKLKGGGVLLLLFAALVAALVAAQPAYATNGTWAGSGTETDPYQIADAADLQELATQTNTGSSWAGVYFVLVNDIDLSGIESWTPIGSLSTRSFNGHFDGQGHTISNLTTTGTTNQGLFGYAGSRNSSDEDTTIENFTVTGSVSGSSYTAGVVARSQYCLYLSNIQTRVDVTSSGSYAGGIVGYAYNGIRVESCSNYGDIEGTYGVAGIVGYYRYDSSIDGGIINCYNVGDVTSTSSTSTTYAYAGGIVCYMSLSSNYKTTLANCYNAGTITSQGTTANRVGGIVAYVYGSITSTAGIANNSIKSCYSLEGSCSAVYGAFYSTSTSSNIRDAATVTTKTEAEMQSEDFVELLNTSDEDAFEYVPGGNYPVLVGEIPDAALIISKQPSDLDWVVNASGVTPLTVEVSALLEYGDVQYQWYSCDDENRSNAQPISDATSASYTPDVSELGTYYYYCIVSNDKVERLSQVATVRVWSGEPAPAPTVAVLEPTSYSVAQTTKVELSIQASAAPENGGQVYQWYMGEAGSAALAIDGANASTYTVDTTALNPDTTYEFYCVVGNWSEVESNLAYATSGSYTVTVLPYLIESADDLVAFAAEVNGTVEGADAKTFEGVTVYLANDIDLEGVGMTPIGTSDNPFKGIFDGQGHTISNLSIEGTSYVGLFGYIVGDADDPKTTGVKNLVIEGKVNGTGAYVGGVVGRLYSGTLQNVGSNVVVTSTYDGGNSSSSWLAYVGGLVGGIQTGSNVVIDGCYNHGSVTSTEETARGVGGLVGATANAGTGTLSILNSYNTGTVSGAYDRVGGLAGGVVSGTTFTIESSYNAGTVSYIGTGETPEDFGAVAGIGSAVAVVNVYYNIDVAGDLGAAPSGTAVASAAIGVDSEEMREIVSDLNGEGESAFAYDAYSINNGYPVLAWEISGDEYASNPQLTGQSSRVALPVKEGAVATASVSAVAPSEGVELSYQWYVEEEDGDWEAIEGATRATYNVSRAVASDASYRCKVSAVVDGKTYSVDSIPVEIVIYEAAVAPVITTQPTAPESELTQGESECTLSVVAGEPSDGGVLSYQWYAAESETSAGSPIDGATSATYTVPVEDLGTVYYYCVVTNTCGAPENTASTTTDAVKVVVVPLTIGTADDLADFAESVNNGETFSGRTVVLTADINLDDLSSNKTFYSIGYSSSYYFAGTFNGDGHSVTVDLTTDNRKDGTGLGLFGYVANATIENVVVKGSVSGGTQTGALVGTAGAGVTITNVGNEADVTTTSGTTTSSGIGGLVGYVSGTNLTISDSYNKGSVSATGSSYVRNVGGLVGYASYTCVFENCYNTGEVSSQEYVGGFLGAVSGTSTRIYLTNCYSAGEVYLTPSRTSFLYCGIFVGYPSTNSNCITFTNCYYDSELMNSTYSENYVEGSCYPTQNVVGDSTNDGTSTYYNGTVTGLTTAEMKAAASSLNTDEANPGYTDNADGYPQLVWETSTTIKDYELSLTSDLVYTGEKLTPTFTLASTTGTPVESANYEVTIYSDSATTEVVEEIVNAGTYYATAKATVDSYTGTTEDVLEFEVAKAPLTATYVSETVDYGAEPALVVEVTGFVNGETAETAAGYEAPTVTAPATLDAICGYELTPEGGSANNYEFTTYVSGILTVGKMPATISVDPDEVVVETGASQTVNVAYTGDGEITVASSNNELATASYNDGQVVIEGKSTGTVVITVSAAEGTECLAADPVTISVEIIAPDGNFATDGFTLSAGDLTYTGVALEPSFTVTSSSGSTVNSDLYEVAIYTDSDCTAEATEVKNAGTYYAQATAIEGMGYTGTTPTTSFEVAKAQLTATYVDESVAYGDTPALAVEVTGFVNGETAEAAAGYVAPTVTAPATLDPGETYELTPAGGSADNYEFDYVSGTLTVGKIPAVIAPEQESVSVADGSTASIEVSYNGDGMVNAVSSNEDVATASYADGGLTITAVAPGTAVITLSAEETDTYQAAESVEIAVEVYAELSGDYLLVSSFDSYTYTGSDVQPRFTLTSTAGSIVPESEYSVTLYADAECTVEVDEVVNVGTYYAVATANEGSVYRGSTEATSFSVTPLEVSAPTAATGLVYTGLEQTGVAACDRYVVENGTATNAGTYTATVALADTNNTVWANAAEGQETAPLSVAYEITKAELTASYVSETIESDETPALVVEVTGFVNGETAETAAGYVAPTVTAPATIEAEQTYELTPAGGSADNYSFAYISGTLTVETAVPFENPFTDIDLTDEAVNWVYYEGWLELVYENGLMRGYTDANGNPTYEFRPTASISRAESIVIIYRHACMLDETLEATYGSTTDPSNYSNDGLNYFSDAGSGDYYTAALAWAYDNSIMTGDADSDTGVTPDITTVRPNDSISRQELATLVYRYAVNYCNADATGADSSSYASAPDADAVMTYAEAAMGWCYYNGALTGDSVTKMLDPFGTASRIQAAKILGQSLINVVGLG